MRSRIRFCGWIGLYFLSFFIGVQAETTSRAHITILSTTDLHGHIDPIDYYTNKPANTGLAKVATVVKKARKSDPDLLLLDSGDTIQGTPLVYYHNRKNNAPSDPMMLAMNALRYDAMTLGNHEYNFGLDVLDKARSEAKFPWLSANTYFASTHKTAYSPYLIKEIQGVRVAVLGLTTPGIPVWENPENFKGLEFRDAAAEAKKWVPILREKERADVVVVAMHMGIEEDLATGQRWPTNIPNENAGVAIANTVPGIDVILMGHTHREIPSLYINGILLTQADRWGDCVARADLYLEKKGEPSSWKVIARAARTIPIDEAVAPDPEIIALNEPYHRETQAWLDKVIGDCPADVSAASGYTQDTALLDLIQRVQLDASGADVSLAATFNPRARIAKGPVTVRDIASLYIYENTLVVLDITGAQFKEALEYSARFFRPYEPGKSAAYLVDKRIPGYNFDVAEGVDYEIDLTRRQGERIRNLTFHGKPLDPGQKLKLAVNNYRYNGGGGYTMFKNAPILSKSSEEIRDLIIAWVEKHGVIPTEATNNWKIVTQ
ncbi:MAG TPA: bifunctional UDP-sugar hydrolase/5'-nucleotidase [Chthoniobacterales bacterium]